MSSYKAFLLVELKQKIPYPIEAIATAGRLIFVGTADGKLVIYELSADRRGLRCLHIHTVKRKRPVIAVVPILEKHILIAATEDTILVYRLEAPAGPELMEGPQEDGLQEVSAITGVKDICALHVKRHKGVFSMAVLHRRKLSVYEYREQGHRKEFVLVRDGPQLPDGGKSLTWAGRNIIVAFRREYVLVDVASGMIDSLYPSSAGKGASPLLLSMDPVPEVLVDNGRGSGARALHDGTLLSDSDHNVLVWPSLPNGAAYVHPFLLTSHSSCGLEVRLPFASGNAGQLSGLPLGQSIVCKGIERIAHRSYADFDATLPHKNTPSDAFRRDLTIATSGGGGNTANTVYVIELVPPREQVMALISAKQFETGLLLCELCVNEVDELVVKNVQAQYACWCIQKRGDVRTAMLRFRDSGVDPRLVISLFPNLLIERARDSWQTPSGLTDSLPSLDCFGGVVCSRESVDLLLDYLVAIRPAYMARHSNVRENGDASPSFDLSLLLEAVDTAILKAYVFLDQEKELVAFLCGENACVLKESEECLLGAELWVGLVALWRRQELHEESLGLLKELALTGQPSASGTLTALEGRSRGGSVSTKENFDSGFLLILCDLLPKVLVFDGTQNNVLVPQRVVVEHLEASYREGLESQQFIRVTRRCIGVVTTILYLRHLAWDKPDVFSLVTCHALWVLANIPPVWSVKMFPVDKMTVEQQAAVLQLVRTDMTDIGCTTQSERVVEWLSLVLGDHGTPCTDAGIHNAYWQSLAEVVFGGDEQSKLAGASAAPGVEDVEMRQKRRKTLCDFLGSSSFMDVHAARTYLEQPAVRSQAFTERAVVYERLRLHPEAVRMFLYEMNELEEAKVYAARVSRDGDDVFSVLLRELLHPPDGEEPRLEEAMAIVSTYGNIDPLTTLSLLPDNTPIAAIENFLRRALCVAAMQNRSAAIYASVLTARVRQAEGVLERARAERVVVDIDTSCAVCGKRLRPGTVFARFPNGTLVHHACIDDDSVCPVTHRDFRKGVETAAREVL